MRTNPLIFTAFFGSAILFLTSCAASGMSGADDAVTALEWAKTPTVIWTNNDILMSATKVESDVALAYVAVGSGKEIVLARDALTGRQLWREDAAPGLDAPGIAHDIPIAGDEGVPTTAFLVPTEGSQGYIWNKLAVVDVATGAAVTPPITRSTLSSRPHPCLQTFCVTGRFAARGVNSLLAYDSEGGSLGVAQGTNVPYLEDGRFLGNFVSSSTSDEQEALNFGENGQITWSRPYTDVFGNGTSSDAGWAWIDDEPGIPIVGVGYTYAKLDMSQPFDHENDMTESRLVGLDRDTGATLWQHDGLIPCAATNERIAYSDGILVACRMNSGTATVHWDGSRVTEVSYKDGDVDLVGIDPARGDIRWTLGLGSDIANIASPDWGGRTFKVGDVPIITLDGSAVVVDSASGSTSPVPPDSVLLCAQKREDIALLGAWNNGESYTYPTAPVFATCSPTGEVLEGRSPSVGTLAAAGYDTSVISVVNLTTGVTAFAPTQ